MQQSRKLKKTVKRQQSSHVRIIGGELRGRRISFSSAEGLRPTLDRVRETLFNWLIADVHDAVCLDLFAGSGALGFEAISRGAQSVYWIDANQKVCRNLSKNINAIGIKNGHVINQKAEQFLKANQQKFDLVFLDPPFEKGMLDSIMQQIKPYLAENALVYVEQENADSRVEFASEWEVVKSKKTSRFYYELLRLQS